MTKYCRVLFVALAVSIGACASVANQPEVQPAPVPAPQQPAVAQPQAFVAPAPRETPSPFKEKTQAANEAPLHCDESLWAHVYPGDPRKFSTPQDRLNVIQDCVRVTGVIDSAVREKDGDWHIRLKVDPQYQSMLNAKNMSGQKGHLVLEPVCSNPVTQPDTIQEGSCVGFSQHLYTQSLLHRHVEAIGAYVNDTEHGWNEIHPVTSLSPL